MKIKTQLLSFCISCASRFWLPRKVFLRSASRPIKNPLRPRPRPAPPSWLTVEAANADLKTARTANQEKRYADAEALMVRDTAARSDMPYLWIELGQAQLGEKKYDDAEASFKAALGGGGQVKATAAKEGFYAADGKGTHSGITHLGCGSHNCKAKSARKCKGISYSSLGQLYILSNKVPDAKAAFDEAAKDFPGAGAALLSQ